MERVCDSVVVADRGNGDVEGYIQPRGEYDEYVEGHLLEVHLSVPGLGSALDEHDELVGGVDGEQPAHSGARDADGQVPRVAHLCRITPISWAHWALAR